MARLLLSVLILLWLPFPVVQAEEISSAPRNLILISIDTLRPDRLGCYGHDRPTSPAIDRLSARGTRFETALATSPWTKPSHASMLTGRYPSRHGAASMAAPLDKRATTLASLLSARGFQTAALVNASWLSRDGLERGFDEMHWTKYIQGKRAGSGMADIAIDWLDKRAADPANNSQRFFLFLHMMDVHSDYASTERYETMFADEYKGPIDGTTQQLYRHLLGELTVETAAAAHLRSLYDAGIRQLDDSLGRLFAVLEKQGRNRDTLIVLTSDHGEEFLEHGGVLHGHTQYEEVVRVPLILAGPGVPHKTIADPVSLIDIVPTVLDLLDEPEARALDGRSLKPALDGRTLPERALYLEADTIFPPRKPGLADPGMHRAVRSSRFKLYYHRNSERFVLYDLVVDPQEKRNAAKAQPDETRMLLKLLNCSLALKPASDPCAMSLEKSAEK